MYCSVLLDSEKQCNNNRVFRGWVLHKTLFIYFVFGTFKNVYYFTFIFVSKIVIVKSHQRIDSKYTVVAQ